MSFGQRFHIELLFVTLIMGILAAVFIDYSRIYLRVVSLVEPLFYAQELKIDISPQYAATGRWPVKDHSAKVDFYPFYDSISAYDVNKNGDMRIILKSRYRDLDGRPFDFILNQYVTEQGYIFNSWRCGGAESPSPYSRKGSASKEISRLISDPICRRK